MFLPSRLWIRVPQGTPTLNKGNTMNNQQMKTEYMSEKTKVFMKKHNRNLKIENVLKSCLLMAIPLGLLVLIVLDFVGVFKISNLI